MGIDSKKAPPLPAPTEDSTSPSDLETTPTDVSGPGDEKSAYSLPDDGTPVTIKTRSRHNKQTSLFIEYSDHKTGTSDAEADRRPSVRVRLTTPPSRGKNGAGRIQTTEAIDPYKASSYTRRGPPSPLTAPQPAQLRDGEDDRSIGSYASATEESNVSRNQPIDNGFDIGRSGRRRRPASPLIPTQPDDTMASLMHSTHSEISAIPTDSFLDGSGPMRSSDGRWISSPNSAEKLKNTKTRTASRERVKIPSSDKERPDRKHKSSKSRTSSGADRYADEVKSPRRRSSRNHEPAASAVDSSVVSSSFSPSHRSMDQQSMRSESSSKSINNPKLLEAVEDAIRRLILPELSSLRREQSMRDTARRNSVVSTGTSISREDLLAERRKPFEKPRDPKFKDRRDREGRHDYADASTRALDRDSTDGSSILDAEPQTPRHKGTDGYKTGAAAAAGGLAVAALANTPSDDKKQRRRKRAEGARSRSRASDAYTDDFDDDDHVAPAPPMPLMSEINPSEVTRTSILSADTDRPHSATEEAASAVREAIRPLSVESTPTPTKTPTSLLKTLATQHANVSHGDLTALRDQRDTGTSDQHIEYSRAPPPFDDPAMDEPDDSHFDDTYASSPYDYYNTQDVPPPLRYEPYQPERRGLSPIYSVSGYTEASGDGPQHKDSRNFAHNDSRSDLLEKPSQRDLSVHSPVSARSNAMGRESDIRSDGRSSVADYRHMPAEGSDLDPARSRQAVQGIGANPDIVHVPVGLESHVASLVDGSMIDQSVLSQDYAQRDSTISYNEGSRSYVDDRSSPAKRSVDSRQYVEDERATTPTSRDHAQRSREFAEYDLDKYGRKIAQSQYRQSPTDSEAAITASAAAKAIKALKANQGRQTVEEETEPEDAFVPAGVQRNKSFKERTLAGHEPATTPTHSVDRLDYEGSPPKMGASGLPDLDHPMPEIGYLDESVTNTPGSIVKERLDGATDAASWAQRSLQSTPKPHVEISRKPVPGESTDRQGLGITEMATAAALGAAGAMAANHSRQPSNDHEDEWHRTSEDRKRDTMGTNPFEGVSPVANPQLGDNLYGDANYDIGFHTGSPGGPLDDEGYKSQGPNYTPDFGADQGVGGTRTVELQDGADPFYEPPKTGHARHLSGMSHGMDTPFYDASTGGGIDRIESKDIVALMQELVARDAQRTARDTEIAATVMFLAKEMRVSFRSVEDRIRQAEDVLADELQETEKAIVKTIGGPRPFPGSAPRSSQGSQGGEDVAVKKGNIIRRALKGLRTSGTNDLTRIEDMLYTLLRDVDDLKAQTAQQSRSGTRPSLDEHDLGYEPEARDAASISSQPTQSGRLSAPQPRNLQRQFSENRVSTVPEASEDEQDLQHHERQLAQDRQDGYDSGGRFSNTNLLTPGQTNQRGSSVPLETPPQTSQAAHSGSLSNENTPRTEKGKKHKSGGSSSWIPKISRWSETTASTVSKAFRGSGASKKDREAEFMNTAHSRSSSDLGTYGDDYHNDSYADDYLHTGHSDPALAPPNPQHLQHPDVEAPRMYMTPEDPKYKAHRNSLNLQHPQPRAGQTERFKAALESQAHIYDSTMTPRSNDWHGSTPSLARPGAHHAPRHSDASGPAAGEYWAGDAGGPPRPPKEPLEGGAGTPGRAGGRPSKLGMTSPLPYHSVESGYGTGTATHTNYTGSPKPENRNLSAALGVPARRPSGPRAMTPKSAEEEAAREERRRKRDTFGSVASRASEDTDTF